MNSVVIVTNEKGARHALKSNFKFYNYEEI